MHTKGPWKISHVCNDSEWVDVSSDNATGECPILASTRHQSLGTNEANATLIAAAPNLLEVCELAEDMPEINFCNYDFDDVAALQAWAFRVVDAMRAARELATKGTE